MLDMHMARYPQIPLALFTLSPITKPGEPMCLLMFSDRLCKTLLTRIGLCLYWMHEKSLKTIPRMKETPEIEVGCIVIMGGAVMMCQV